MYKDSDKPILDLIRNTVREQEPTAEIILYGSRARGDARPDSDWDVIVLVDRPQPRLSWKERGNLDYDLWDKGIDIGEEINARTYTKQEWEIKPKTAFKYFVQTEGIKL